MSLIAVDIVLLPSLPIMNEVIELIDYSNDSVICLNAQNCLPHISLAMGVFDDKNIAEAGAVLNELAQRLDLLELEISRTQTKTIADGKDISEAVIDHNPRLTELHLELMKLLNPLLTHENVQTNMFFSPPQVADISTTWVKHYFDKKTPSE